MTRAFLIVFLLAVVAGCQTAKGSFEAAAKAEAEGRWAAAAELYIDALRRDPEYPGARDGLLGAGNKAIAGFVKAARDLEASSQYEHAAGEYVRTDSLVGRAASVRVALQTPSGYAQQRRATFDRVIDATLKRADDLAAAGRWEQADSAYRTAIGRYEPSEQQRARARQGMFDALMGGANGAMEQGDYDRAHALAGRAAGVYGPDSARSKPALELRARIGDARYRALLASARESMEAGRFREALDRAERALAIYGEDDAASADARALREEIISRGTVAVVAMPVWRAERIARFVPDSLLGEIDAMLEQEHWTRPPMFLAMVDARDVRRELRRLDFDREVLSDKRAAAVADTLKSGFAVVPYLQHCAFEAIGRPEPHRVATRDGQGATIQVWRRRRLVARCAYRIVRTQDARTVAEGAVEASSERDGRHATYAGDMRQLLLTQQEHTWFDERRLRDADRELEKETAAQLAEGLAAVAYEELLRQLP